ncbi:MAG: hypothetical protein MUF54_06120 [Polyangiaceae bacterium]|jgi:hypothetical protein|nr:hypothetical protein [Polyangiaceae bacterium]
MRTAIVGAIGAVGALLASPVLANPLIRAALVDELSLNYTPGCSVCHDGTPGSGTATTPFATSMKARGMVSFDTSSVATAIALMTRDGVDSDMDGELDIDELTAGTDPNVAQGVLSTDEGPSYGCGASIAGGDVSYAGGGAAGVAGWLLTAAWVRSRRGKKRGVELRAL